MTHIILLMKHFAATAASSPVTITANLAIFRNANEDKIIGIKTARTNTILIQKDSDKAL